MLSTRFRLPLRSLPDFFTNAHVVRSHYFVVFYESTATTPAEVDLHTSDGPILQAALLVPKKQFAQAVDRNYQKRRVSAAVQQLFQNNWFLSAISQKQCVSLKLVITCKHSIDHLNYSEVQDQLAYVAKKIIVNFSS